MATTKYDKFCRKFGKVSLSYCDPALKDEFHREGKKVLQEIGTALGFTGLDYDLRSNKGGIAVSGEITLHANALYIQISESMGRKIFLVRSCKGRKDFSGGVNNTVNFGQPEVLLQVCQRVLDMGH